MTARSQSLRTRLRPVFCTAVAGAALTLGIALLLAPGSVSGGGWPPLHARCMGVTLLSLAVAIALGQRTGDAAALRLPLQAVAGFGLSMAAAAPWSGSWSSLAAWALGIAGLLLGVAARALTDIDDDPPAPARHPDRAWRGIATLALPVAAALLLAPNIVALHWPWQLKAPLVAQYATMFLAWGYVSWRVALERRRYVREPVLAGLLVWAMGVLLVSLLHKAAFGAFGPAAWLWFAAFVGVAGLAARRAYWRPFG